jgi:hypothetical protein
VHKRKQNGSGSVWLSIANEDGTKVGEQFSEELLLNCCRESKEFISEHKCKAWQHLVPDSITKYRTVLTTKLKKKNIYAIFGLTLVNFFVVLAVFCSDTRLVVSVVEIYTLLFMSENVRYSCCIFLRSCDRAS